MSGEIYLRKYENPTQIYESPGRTKQNLFDPAASLICVKFLQKYVFTPTPLICIHIVLKLYHLSLLEIVWCECQKPKKCSLNLDLYSALFFMLTLGNALKKKDFAYG